jgi:hypothetical protein
MIKRYYGGYPHQKADRLKHDPRNEKFAKSFGDQPACFSLVRLKNWHIYCGLNLSPTLRGSLWLGKKKIVTRTIGGACKGKERKRKGKEICPCLCQFFSHQECVSSMPTRGP